MMMKSNEFTNRLDLMIPNPKCELEYNKPYELLIATVLSAQCSDARVNQVTKVLWHKYTLKTLSKASLKEIENIIYPVGTYHNKAYDIKEIATRLLKDKEGEVPNDFNYLLTLPGVGRKTASVVLGLLFNEPSFAVDTHVFRVSNRLCITKDSDDVISTEVKLKKYFEKEKWNRINSQMVLFGRYVCKSKNPSCESCNLKSICKYYKSH